MSGYQGNGVDYCDGLCFFSHTFLLFFLQLKLATTNFFFYLECGLAYSPANDNNPLNRTATPYSWPSIVLVHFRYKAYVPAESQRTTIVHETNCSGTLVDRRTILTTAQCVPKILFHRTNNNSAPSIVEVTPNEFYTSFDSIYKFYVGAYTNDALNSQIVQYAEIIHVRQIFDILLMIKTKKLKTKKKCD
jgi:hypothetical protein